MNDTRAGNDSNEPEDPETRAASDDRRGFLTKLILGLGGLIGLILAVPLIRYFAYPVGRKVVSSSAEPADAVAADELIAGGEPVKVDLVGSDVRDAWGVADDVNLGAAWVQKREDGSVLAFTSTCPHLGCAVGFNPSSDHFECPCHKSAFDRAGKKLSGPSKRGLDPLPVEVRDGRVRITFKRFKTDISDRREA